MDPKSIRGERALRSCLRRNPSNAQYIRVYANYYSRYLPWVLSHLRILKRLRLMWTTEYDHRNPFYRCLASKLPNSWTQELIFKYNNHYDDYLLQRLAMFEGLTKLAMEITPSRGTQPRTLQEIIDKIQCPQLECLTISGVHEYAAELRKAFPKLKSFDVKPLRLHGEICEVTELCWKTVSRMMDQSIFYRVQTPALNPDAYSLFLPIFRYAQRLSLDPGPMLHWLVESMRFFNSTLHMEDVIEMDFIDDGDQLSLIREISHLIGYFTIALCHPTSLFIEIAEWKGMEVIMNHDGRLIAFVSNELCFLFIAYTLPVLRNLRLLQIQIDLGEEESFCVDRANALVTFKPDNNVGSGSINAIWEDMEMTWKMERHHLKDNWNGRAGAFSEEVEKWFDISPTLVSVKIVVEGFPRSSFELGR